MSYYPSSAYSSYQTPYAPYPNYSAQYSPQGTPTSYVAAYPPGQRPLTPPPLPEAHSAPELSAVTPALASRTIRRLLSAELSAVGFDSAEPVAMRRLELEVIALVEGLYQRAHEYANLANRAGPIAKDLLLASAEYGLQTKELHRKAVESSQKKIEVPVLLPPPSRSPSPELLSSDDENAPPSIPASLRALPHPLPALPPKHTYLRTPISPLKKAALPSLEKKLQNAGLVQESLRNLLLATEDSTGQEDAELLGATVNWEGATRPRKKWKVSS